MNAQSKQSRQISAKGQTRLPKEDYLELGKRIRRIRKELHYSQLEFSALVGLSNSYLSEIESGKAPPPYNAVYKMASLFRVNLDFLFFGSGDPFVEKSTRPISHDREMLDDIDTIDDLVWLMKNSPVFRNSIMAYASKYLFDNKELVRENIKLKRLKDKT